MPSVAAHSSVVVAPRRPYDVGAIATTAYMVSAIENRPRRAAAAASLELEVDLRWWCIAPSATTADGRRLRRGWLIVTLAAGVLGVANVIGVIVLLIAGEWVGAVLGLLAGIAITLLERRLLHWR